jgi:hypothetical protein
MAARLVAIELLLPQQPAWCANHSDPQLFSGMLLPQRVQVRSCTASTDCILEIAVREIRPVRSISPGQVL